MKLNTLEIQKIIIEKHSGNKAEFARVIGVGRSQVSLIINHGQGLGLKFLSAFMNYCKANSLNFEDFIILENPEEKVG